MRKSELPEWVKKYDKKGIAFRKRGANYSMYKVSSYRIPNCSYPKLSQEYLGIVTELDGFIPSKKNLLSNEEFVEIGLSHFIFNNFKRDLLRSFFNTNKEFADVTLKASIIAFIYGYPITKTTISLSSISIGNEDIILKSSTSKKIINVVNNISKMFEEVITDPIDRNDLIAILKQELTIKSNPTFIGYSKKALDILSKYGGDFK